MKISFEIVGVGYANITVEREDGKKWGASLPPGTDLDAPLLCMFADEPVIVPVYIADDVQAAIQAEWAKLEA